MIAKQLYIKKLLKIIVNNELEYAAISTCIPKARTRLTTA